MPNEPVGPSREHGEAHDATKERDNLLWRNSEVRKAAKDLRLNVEALPAAFANRERVLHMIEEILVLVPVLDPKDEAADERDRADLAESQKHARQIWENRDK
jgi:hypothetical protein